MRRSRGRIEVITGTMFSGKTKKLISELKLLRFKEQEYCCFKCATDTRSGNGVIRTNDELELPAIDVPVGHPYKLVDELRRLEKSRTRPFDVVALDEAQFFEGSSCMVDIIDRLAMNGYRVIVAGLDLDYLGKPFGIMPYVLTLADRITKLSSICQKCHRRRARFSQRMIDGAPFTLDGPKTMVGGTDTYEVRCRACYVPPGTYSPSAQPFVYEVCL